MKLPDFIQFAPLNSLRLLMNAPLPEQFIFVSVKTLTADELEKLGKGELVIEDINDVRELDDGTLAYKNRRVLLHIMDVGTYRDRDPHENLPKFHIAHCKRLLEMKNAGRFASRYVVSTRTDGKFSMRFISGYSQPKSEICELKICKWCLQYLSYKGYAGSKRQHIFETFSIDEYFSIYPKSLIVTEPTYTDNTAPVNNYGTGFREVSRRYRAENNWTCKKCGVDLSARSHQQYLDTHHRDGAKYDNKDENLAAVCIRCHAEEPMHAHMKNSPRYKEFMRIYSSLKK